MVLLLPFPVFTTERESERNIEFFDLCILLFFSIPEAKENKQVKGSGDYHFFSNSKTPPFVSQIIIYFVILNVVLTSAHVDL